MRLIERITQALAQRKAKAQERRIGDLVNEERDRFNIVRVNGNDYITYRGHIMSREGDNDLLERIEELRDYAGNLVRTSVKNAL